MSNGEDLVGQKYEEAAERLRTKHQEFVKMIRERLQKATSESVRRLSA